MTKKYVLGVAVLCTVFLLSSCDNFLKGSKNREALERLIEYANTEKYKIKVEAPKGSGIITKPAAGEAEVKPSDVFNLSFNSESDSQFLRWEVYNEITDESLDENPYLLIEDPLMIDTTCTFVTEPEDENIQLAIRAVTAKRPRIIRATPIDQETGVPRNSTVRILFDRFNMDTDCIYYSQEEMQTLKKEFGLQDKDFLKGDDTNCGGKYYGYIKNDIIYFKNIQIVSSTVSGSSLTKYFYDPYWEKNPNDMGGSTLVIKTTNPPPPKDVVVYVTLAKDFCYFEEDIPVTLREATTMSYKTMYDDDPASPVFILPKDSQNNDDYYVIKFKNANGEYEALPFTTDPNSPPSDIPVCNEQEYFYLSFSFSAKDSGGSSIKNSFSLCCENANLPIGETSAPKIELPYVSYTEEEGYVDWTAEYIIPRTQYLKSGKNYCFTLEVADNDNNVLKLRDDQLNKIYFWLNLAQTAIIY
jgi:hypothetical protein